MYKVLIADDDPINNKLLELVLSKIGCTVTTCSNGKEALDMSLIQLFDHILLDIQMPVMNGLEAVCNIKTTMNKNTPVIALSGSDAKEDRLASLMAGFDDHICKLAGSEKLLKKIQRAMKQSEAIKSALCGNDVLSLFSDDESYRQAIDMFISTLPNTISNMCQAFEHKNFAEFQKITHSLKGTGGMAGFPVFSHLCTQIEQAIKEQQFAEIKTILDTLMTLVNKATAGRRH